jgi:hypothetical protein
MFYRPAEGAHDFLVTSALTLYHQVLRANRQALAVPSRFDVAKRNIKDCRDEKHSGYARLRAMEAFQPKAS